LVKITKDKKLNSSNPSIKKLEGRLFTIKKAPFCNLKKIYLIPLAGWLINTPNLARLSQKRLIFPDGFCSYFLPSIIRPESCFHGAPQEKEFF